MQHFKNRQSDEDEHHAQKGDGIIAAPCRDAQAGHGPETGGGGQAPDGGTLPHDGPRTQKAHAGDDLGSQPGGVRGGPVGAVLGEDHLTGEHDGAGPKSHQNVGPHSGGTVGVFPLSSNHGAYHHGTEHS